MTPHRETISRHNALADLPDYSKLTIAQLQHDLRHYQSHLGFYTGDDLSEVKLKMRTIGREMAKRGVRR